MKKKLIIAITLFIAIFIIDQVVKYGFANLKKKKKQKKMKKMESK
jgi:hypothetical protein